MTTVLLVDDVNLFLDLEKSFLEDSGYTVATARSGEEALERLAEVDPAVMLLDLFMPGIDGDEVCRRLRAEERWRHLPVIMVTAAGKDEEIRKCLAAGCDDYLTKPISKKDLLEKIQRLLGEVKGRTAERAAVSLRVRLTGEGQTIEARVRDISTNGVYVKSRAVLTPGTAVELRIDLPDGRELPVMGKVKRVEQSPERGMGIYLIGPELQGQELLKELVGEETASTSAAPAESHLAAEMPLAELQEENRRLHQRIAELEAENRRFAEQVIHTEEINNNLTNLYIASSRLHSVLDRTEVMAIINEVVINFVGAEKFALLLYDEEAGHLQFGAGEGFDPADFPPIPSTDEFWQELISRNDSYFHGDTAGSDDPHQPLAAIPLRTHDRVMGVLAVYRLFTQKEEFAPIDYQIFSMMAEHAATALFSSGLYQKSERKRETYRGLMDLLLK